MKVLMQPPNAEINNHAHPLKKPPAGNPMNIQDLPEKYRKQVTQQRYGKTNPIMATRPQAPIAKPPLRDESLGQGEVQKRASKRPHVRISQFTRRPQDADNCCPKYEIDWLRYKGFITDDNHDAIKLSVQQIKVATPEEEGVLIEIL